MFRLTKPVVFVSRRGFCALSLTSPTVPFSVISWSLGVESYSWVAAVTASCSSSVSSICSRYHRRSEENAIR